jgi:ADP-ribose pyrophosphatase
MRDLTWKTLSSEYVYKDRWFIARKDTCEMPDGKIVEPYYVLEFPNWCNVVLVTSDEKIVLVRQYRHAINATTFELPGGVIDKGETPEQAAIREVQEETGYQVTSLELLYTTAPNPATNNNTAYLYLATNAEPILTQKFDAFEDMDVHLFSKQEIKQMLAENKFMHGIQIGGLYAAFEKLGWMKW